jgi:hypothetical protein
VYEPNVQKRISCNTSRTEWLFNMQAPVNLTELCRRIKVLFDVSWLSADSRETQAVISVTSKPRMSLKHLWVWSRSTKLFYFCLTQSIYLFFARYVISFLIYITISPEFPLGLFVPESKDCPNVGLHSLPCLYTVPCEQGQNLC